ncbi:type II methionyl aminopeptidase [Ignicoccus islandicus]|uniref:type II methionyl aminopeptidase n=1 Tax=Ignicoccus islandicus TaxID=54259 RepID=UPI00143B40C5|nr:type II methionyl aminopeptidase [Ignicoccus islandicus]
MNDLELYLKAGEAVSKALERGFELVKPNASVLEICEEVEDVIRKLSDGPAFPCNLSVSYEAAHYSPIPDDNKKLPEKGIVKLDLGAHVQGRIADAAISIVLDESVKKHVKLSNAVKMALHRAIEKVKPNVPVALIGSTINYTLKKEGFKPIRNLGGHSLGLYLVHSGVSIPNVPERLPFRLEKGGAYAIEPFGTDGAGYVVEGEEVTIFSLNPRPPKHSLLKVSDEEKHLMVEIENRFKTLPFSPRWLLDVYPYDRLIEILASLTKKGILIDYPVLLEAKRGEVAQWEHTILITDKEAIVTTKTSLH